MRRLRRGNAITNWGLVIGGLAFCAVVVDLGWAWAHRARIQHINDAVATAAASRLNSTAEGLIQAELTAAETMNANSYFGTSSLTALYGDVSDSLTFGNFDQETRTFVPSAEPEEINSVRVTAANANIPTIFSGFVFGRDWLAAAATSTAVWGFEGASEVGCYLPIAVPSCYFSEEERETFAQRDFVFQPATVDNISWASTEGNPNAADLSRQIDGTCSGGLAGIGDSITLNNGMIQSVLQTMQNRLAGSDTTWDTAMGPQPARNTGSTHPSYGRTYEAPVFVFNAPASYCEGGNGTFTGTHQIDGIAWGVVYDIRSGGSAANRNIWVRFDFARWHDMGTAGGGPNYGVRARGITQIVE